MEGLHNTHGNSRGVGVIFVFKKCKLQGGGGGLREIPPWWGYGYFLEPHIHPFVEIIIINNNKRLDLMRVT